jgi:hypothetical protein
MRTEFQFFPGPHFLYGKVHRNLRYGLADFCWEKKNYPLLGNCLLWAIFRKLHTELTQFFWLHFSTFKVGLYFGRFLQTHLVTLTANLCGIWSNYMSRSTQWREMHFLFCHSYQSVLHTLGFGVDECVLWLLSKNILIWMFHRHIQMYTYICIQMYT